MLLLIVKTIFKKKDDKRNFFYHLTYNYLFSFTKNESTIPSTNPISAKFNHAKSAGTGKKLTFDNKPSTAGIASLKVEATVECRLIPLLMDIIKQVLEQLLG